MVKFLVADDAVVDHRDLAWTGRGKVKQAYRPRPAGTGRRIHLTGQVRHGEVRVHRGRERQLAGHRRRDYRRGERGRRTRLDETTVAAVP